ncbi:hypothetical protein PcP3B5_21390 [Pseudomonas citronellolis]|nr:hypothetical protein PcP3B5_21390 [Pseudomonas citronellolis]
MGNIIEDSKELEEIHKHLVTESYSPKSLDVKELCKKYDEHVKPKLEKWIPKLEALGFSKLVELLKFMMLIVGAGCALTKKMD